MNDRRCHGVAAPVLDASRGGRQGESLFAIGIIIAAAEKVAGIDGVVDLAYQAVNAIPEWRDHNSTSRIAVGAAEEAAGNIGCRPQRRPPLTRLRRRQKS